MDAAEARLRDILAKDEYGDTLIPPFIELSYSLFQR